MTFRPQCPKCGHRPLSYERDTRARVDIVSCYTCAWKLYGLKNIERLIQEQRDGHQITVAELKAKKIVEKQKDDPDWPRCSWADCDNPTKQGRGGKALKYCSRRCGLKHAHQRDRIRKHGK